METFKQSIIINAQPEKVFEYIDDPMNDPEWMIGMVEVHEVEGLPGVGRHFHWTFKMVGIPLKDRAPRLSTCPTAEQSRKAKVGCRAHGLPMSSPRAKAQSSR